VSFRQPSTHTKSTSNTKSDPEALSHGPRSKQITPLPSLRPLLKNKTDSHIKGDKTPPRNKSTICLIKGVGLIEHASCQVSCWQRQKRGQDSYLRLKNKEAQVEARGSVRTACLPDERLHQLDLGPAVPRPGAPLERLGHGTDKAPDVPPLVEDRPVEVGLAEG
jgi:hypothetical protein